MVLLYLAVSVDAVPGRVLIGLFALGSRWRSTMRALGLSRGDRVEMVARSAELHGHEGIGLTSDLSI
jgi:hypothetical protein